MKRWSIILVSVAAGCGSLGDDGSKAAPEPTAGAANVVPSQEVLLEAPPSARCTLRPDSDDPSQQIALDADQDGLVRVVVSETMLGADVPPGRIECTSPTGTMVVRAFDLRTIMPSQPGLRAKEASIVARWKDRPVLTGDPMGYTQAELLRGGFPMRPDPQAQPDAFGRWMEAVSRPAKAAPSDLRERPGVFHDGYTANWDAVIVTQPGLTFDMVSGVWHVPQIVGFTPGSSDSSLWVGLDGDKNTSPDVVQDGTDQNEYCYRSGLTYKCVVSYVAWVEWFPLHTQYLSNFAVQPGDTILAQAWVGDSSGNINPFGGRAWFYIYNYRTGIYYSGSTPPKPGTVFKGNMAEAVMEKFSDGDALADFQQASITSFYTWVNNDGNTTTHNFSTDFTDLYHLTSDGTVNGHLLATAQKSDATTATFFWQKYR